MNINVTTKGMLQLVAGVASIYSAILSNWDAVMYCCGFFVLLIPLSEGKP